MSVRQPSFADDSWYSSAATALQEQIGGWLASARTSQTGPAALAVIAPHAGHSFSGSVAARAIAALRPARRIVLVGPAHRAWSTRAAAVTTGASAWATPLGETQVDSAGVEALRNGGAEVADVSQEASEHSLEVLLPIIQLAQPDASIVPLSLSGTPSESLISALKQLLADSDTACVISSDFCHFGDRFNYLPAKEEGESWGDAVERVDKVCIAAVLACDAEQFGGALAATGNTICGQYAIAALLRTGAVNNAKLLEYKISSPPSPAEGSVSYAAIALW